MKSIDWQCPLHPNPCDGWTVFSAWADNANALAGVFRRAAWLLCHHFETLLTHCGATTENMNLSPKPVPALSLFSIVIPSWNNLALLKLCVGSVKANSAFGHQIIIHVNDGSDGTLDWVRASGLAHTHSGQNTGICVTVNQAAGLAQHDLILYLNDDMYCCPQWDTQLLNKVQEIGHDAFMLSGTLIEPIDSGNPCVRVCDFGLDADSFAQRELLKKYRSLAKPDWFG